MKLRKFCAFVLIALSSMVIISCGGSGGANGFGGDVFLSTSRVAANANPSTVDADIMIDAVNPGTIHKDTVSVTVASTATATPALPVQVNSVIVSYVALNGGPALADQPYNLNQTITGGSNAVIPVDVTTLNQKTQILAPIYTGVVFDYDVTLTFNVSEVGGTNAKSGNPVAKATVHFANFKDS